LTNTRRKWDPARDRRRIESFQAVDRDRFVGELDPLFGSDPDARASSEQEQQRDGMNNDAFMESLVMTRRVANRPRC
jgi:hypothetical protein